MQAPILEELDRQIAPLGLYQLGAFHCSQDDQVFLSSIGLETVQTIVLVGNVGSSHWQAVKASGDHLPPDPKQHPMNKWSQQVLGPIAERLACKIVYPFKGPPFFPFVRWGLQTAEIFQSPLGMGLHARHGIFHAYRGAFLFEEKHNFETGKQEMGKEEVAALSPCDGCAEKPCLSACPVDAFNAGMYDYQSCRAHVGGNPESPCWQGCLARRACPVGQNNHYNADHAYFHMQAFVDPAVEV
ncbi:MAG: hypothetical protein N4A65_09785 [Cohaesibacter sp.]|jgi:hypothetical protein|nr:hypothetical protein [Cohaesibacter sp.]